MMERAHSNAKQAVEQRRAAWQVRLQEEINRMLDILRTSPDIEGVFLFGSGGRGQPRYHSDIDLVVVQRTPLRFLDRLEALYRMLHPRISTDLLVYTPTEWDAMCQDNGFGHRVLKEGKTLYAVATQ